MKKKILPFLILAQIYSYSINKIDPLDNFFGKNTSTIEANFTQTQIGIKKNTVTTGSVKIKRPNKFIWNYNDGQQIICDGKTIYIYDKELNQVETKKYNVSIEKTPALLLSGTSSITNEYNIITINKNDNLKWFKLVPKKDTESNQVKSIEIAFINNKLSKMNFIDNLNHQIQINFSNLKENNQLSDKSFTFIIPKSVDIINSDS